MSDHRPYFVRTADIKANLLGEISLLPLDPVHVVTIKEDKPNRSVAQNRFMWKLFEIIGDFHGYTKDQTHREMMVLFLTPDVYTGLDGQVREIYSTSNLKVGPMSEFLEHLLQHGAEWGLIMPMPGEVP
jgi:hypothetical protein